MSQQLTMTPQMQQAMKILQLSRLELEQYIQTQMAENPVLEEQDYGPEEPLSKIERTTEDVLLDQLKSLDGSEAQEVDWEMMARHKEALLASTPSRSTTHRENHPIDHVISATTTLAEHLLDQVMLMPISSKQKRIASEIIGNINEKGFLVTPLTEIAQMIEPGEYSQVTPEEMEEVLGWVQKCDPTGSGSRSLAECLTLQMKEWGKENKHLLKIVSSQTKELERKDYTRIAKNLRISLAEVDAAVAVLAELEPIPGRAFLIRPSPYISVDVSVVKIGENWRVISHDDGLPSLQISHHYKDMLSGTDNKPTANYLSDKMRSAQWLMKAIWQRQSSILKVAQVIVAKQKAFFEKGAYHLLPMTLKDVAEMIEVHESTISRVTAGKYIQTPRGIFELRYFFSSSIPSRDNAALASESVRKIIAKMIADEDPKHPLSDQKIVEILTIRGMTIARRTVAKYRDQLSIPSSSQRRRFA